ncbi:MAG: YhcH/YjgK/YiaL family protein [Neisseriaceae bacterium]|nr:YhcH/YjgK/YiaL family protein [Neisseriaceae bacterium]MBR7059656.1 YhcH/YjgK/YiaL family protein [Neisseriaceae bacterium]
MIFDRLDNLLDYAVLLPSLERIKTILDSQNLSDLPCMRYTDSDDLYYNIDSYTTIQTPKQFEFHRQFADVQIMLQGKEIHQISDRSNTSLSNDFDEKRDIGFFPADSTANFIADMNHFLIYLPNEPHRSQIAIDEPSAVKKVVFKIRYLL